MTSLDISSNSIGLIDIFPDGWRSKHNNGRAPFVHTDGRKQNAVPNGAKSSGVVAIANAIPDMGAMTSLNLASNRICLYGNMDGIKAIFSAVQVLAIILVPFSSLSDLSFNCWCLLLSPGYEGDDEPGYQQQ